MNKLARGLAWLQPERLLKETILHLAYSFGVCSSSFSSSRSLWFARSKSLSPWLSFPGSSTTRKGTSRRGPWEQSCPFPSSQFDAGYQLVTSVSLKQMVSWNSQSTYEKRGGGGREYANHCKSTVRGLYMIKIAPEEKFAMIDSSWL